MKKKQLQERLQELGIAPTKSKGQNFLIDEMVVDKIISHVDFNSVNSILEIGPGLGVLTQQLSLFAKNLYCVELEQKLAENLKQEYAHQEQVQIFNEDILDFDPNRIDGSYAIVANLPYQITSAIFRKFLTAEKKPTFMIVMVQKEVAQRICAKTGKHSLLSLSVQYFGNPKLLFTVSKKSFYPEPQVQSAVISITDIIDRESKEEYAFFRAIKAGFSHKRKKLVSNLAAHKLCEKEKCEDVLTQLGYESGARAQHVSLTDWIELAKGFSS